MNIFNVSLKRPLRKNNGHTATKETAITFKRSRIHLSHFSIDRLMLCAW